jgi:broad specificity phosphatase PhoE
LLQRIFVLRGQELSYYTIDNKQRYGALKGTWDVAGSTVERLDNASFSLTLANGSVRSLGAPNVQTLMDWMTAIAVAAEARIVQPTTDLSLVDQSRTTHVILVRHGHYASSQTPSVDVHGPLTDLGVQQARATGRFLHTYLSERLVLKRFPKFPVYHSGVRRAVETAERMGEAFPPGTLQLRENKLFREAWPGNPLPSGNRQQLAREKLDNMVSDCARLKMAYRTTFRHLIPQDLELEERALSDDDVKLYASTFGARSTQTRAQDRFRVVVCHANIIRWLVCKALGVDPDGTWGRMRYNHCGVTAMEIDSVGNVQLTYMNQTGHLDTTQLSEV